MTEDIKSILEASDAARSLRMEARVAKIFSALGWDAQTIVYYNDHETKKLREIDVVAKTLFNKPEVHDGIGSPVVNLNVICECKDLKGSNILFFDAGSHSSMLRPQHYWIGEDVETKRIVQQIAKVLEISSMSDLNALYDYFVERAYANKGRAFRYDLRDYLPVVDVTAQAFRETKGGTLAENEKTEGLKSNPMWNAVRSVTSAMEAFEQSARDISQEYLTINELPFWSFKDIASHIAFAFDTQLARYVIFHPVVISKAKLWKVDQEAILEVSSARIVTKGMDADWKYVDIVNEDAFEDYIRKAAKIVKSKAERSNSALNKIFRRLNWSPAQKEDVLSAILRPFLRRIS